jgi:hypothetical protein
MIVSMDTPGMDLMVAKAIRALPFPERLITYRMVRELADARCNRAPIIEGARKLVLRFCRAMVAFDG